ncbi:glycosyltransferase [Patescibacteria group bacterium]|nr:glycosyltransferase [Candidatus Micrarchaeota archaeon]MBU1758365.1 glycosyltransferase [Patescibacteria group bacterium]
MKLAIVNSNLTVCGGIERVVLEIAKHFDAHIYCPYYDPENTFDEYRNLHITTLKPSNIPIRHKVLSTLETTNYFYNMKLEDYDLVNPHGPLSEFVRHRNSPVLWYCYSPHRLAFDLYEWHLKQQSLAYKIPFLVWIKFFKHLESQTVPKIEEILTISNVAQKRIKKYLNRDAEIIHIGVDSQKFSCRDYEQFFLYPSRLAPEKDFEYAIKAFKLFSSKNKGWKLVIAGFVADIHKPYFEKVKSLCDDSFIIETNVSDERLYDLYSRCYATVFSPIEEDFGIVPLEAMASSKPVIARNEGGPKETVSDGVDGFLVNSPQEMAQRMEWLAKNPDICEKMGKAGKKKVKKYFTWERFLKRFEEKAKETITKKSES